MVPDQSHPPFVGTPTWLTIAPPLTTAFGHPRPLGFASGCVDAIGCGAGGAAKKPPVGGAVATVPGDVVGTVCATTLPIEALSEAATIDTTYFTRRRPRGRDIAYPGTACYP